MSSLIIQGGRPIQGVFEPSGNKNGALPMIAASLLTDEPVVLHNVPAILDVEVMLDLVGGLGVTVERTGRTVRLCSASLNSREPDANRCRRVRASILLSGPLAARHGSARLPPPGGDGIGRRRLDPHLYGLRALGIEIDAGESLTFSRGRLRGTDILLDEASVTATENVLMAATLAEGRTTLFPAACEPHVSDLSEMLLKRGARIEGHGTNRIEVYGVNRLQGVEHRVAPDYIETGSFLAAAAITGGELTIRHPKDSQAIRVLARGFGRMGLHWRAGGESFTLNAGQDLQVQQDLGFSIPTVESGIWPAFPSDMMSVAVVVATQARGSILFFEKLFESRMYFVDRLLEMGAQIIQCDPHRVVVQGKSQLQATHMSSPDIRAGMAMVVAALCAEGESRIDQAQMIDRGYESVDERLRRLGASVERRP